MPPSAVVVAAVDDDRRVRESVQSVLESAGYEAITFESAETFLFSGALSRVACVIVDVRLPGMAGTELQRRIRRREVEAALSANAYWRRQLSEQQAARARAFGACARRADHV